MKRIFTLFFLVIFVSGKSQLLSWSPQFPTDTSSIIIIVDANSGDKGLLGYANTNDVYVHTGVITNLSANAGDWKHVKYNDFNTPSQTVKCDYLGNNKWSFTIAGGVRTFYNITDASEKVQKIAILFRNGAGTKVQRNADGSDMYIPVYPTGYEGVQFTNPFLRPTYTISHEAITAGLNTTVSVSAVASQSGGTLNLYFNGTKISGPITGANTISGSASATASGNQQFIAEYINNGVSYYDTVSYYLPPVNVIAALPAGVKEGINYDPDCTKATLVLYAPHKNYVIVVGDFPGSNWAPVAQFQMNKTPDSSYYWLTINNLVAGTEYAFNYKVDDSIYIADPYTEKVLDPANDQYISTATYPNLKPYPVNINVSASKNGIMSVLQTCQPAYNWQATSYTRPDKKNLITYELLVRDFGDARNYQMLIDTISYFKRLGINSIELMPVNEFTGNDSWGYNPTFYCALDKAYGTKDKFKEFIDLCHQNGIAVILDVVFNHMDAYSNPEGRLYWNGDKPAANSPWFNQSAPHPYSVFNDLNHTSAATQYLVERSLDYWVSEYRVDGYRLDLGKGFTQTQSNEGTIENYDASRVANLERYYDVLKAKYPDTYMIIEFLGQQRQEEQEYASHGFMLWGNNNPTYNQCTMGYTDNSNISKIVYSSGEEAFATPAEMGYMESHDEERLMFKNLSYGNGSGSYSVKNLATAVERNAAAAALFFTVPGPKMIWQFGERGYDISINANGGRTNAKPPHWEYMQDANRLKLWNTYASLIHLRLQNPATFNSNDFSFDLSDNGGLFRRFQIADPNTGGLKIAVVANFDVVPQTRSITFQGTGTWYSFLGNGTGTGLNGATGSMVNISTTLQSITLQPGEYHVYTSQLVVLPLRLISFAGKRSAQNIALAWTTANEGTVKNYGIERSLDGIHYSSISVVPAKNITTGQLYYAFTDSDPLAVKSSSAVFYRLQMTDADGKVTFSNIAKVNPTEGTSQFSLFPNPAAGEVMYMSFAKPLTSKIAVKIEDISGRLYSTTTFSLSNSSLVPVDVSKLANGTYIIKAETDKQSFVKRFVVQH